MAIAADRDEFVDAELAWLDEMDRLQTMHIVRRLQKLNKADLMVLARHYRVDTHIWQWSGKASLCAEIADAMISAGDDWRV